MKTWQVILTGTVLAISATSMPLVLIFAAVFVLDTLIGNGVAVSLEIVAFIFFCLGVITEEWVRLVFDTK